MKNKILTAVICCDFKQYSLIDCVKSIKSAGFEDILLNYETFTGSICNECTQTKSRTLQLTN
jgi:hypothetical protein